MNESNLNYLNNNIDDKIKDLIKYKRNLLKNIIEREDEENRIKRIRDFVFKNFVYIKFINDKNFDTLIYSIENDFSMEEISFIIENFKYENLNLYIYDENNGNNGMYKVPLFSAIARNKFDIADLLIENGADIKYKIPVYNNGNIFAYLIDITYNFRKNNLDDNNFGLNYRNIEYIFGKNFKLNNSDSKVIYKLIEECIEPTDKNIDTSLEIFDLIRKIFNEYIFDSSFMKKIIKMYRNNDITKEKLEELINIEKRKIDIEDEYYSYPSNNYFTIVDEKTRYNIIKTLFENDGSIPIIMAYRAIRFKIFNISSKLNDRNLEIFARSFTKNYLDHKKIYKLVIDYNEVDNNKRRDIRDLIQALLYEHENEGNRYLNYILIVFIRYDKKNLIKYLIEEDDFELDINEPDHKDRYPVIEALNYNNKEIFEYLLRKGADCNTKDTNGISLSELVEYHDPLFKSIFEKYREEQEQMNIDIVDNNDNETTDQTENKTTDEAMDIKYN